MNEAPFEEIELKIIQYLRKVKAPNVPSLIATEIRETREDTLQAIERLVKKGILHSERDFTFFNNTGETKAFFII